MIKYDDFKLFLPRYYKQAIDEVLMSLPPQLREPEKAELILEKMLATDDSHFKARLFVLGESPHAAFRSLANFHLLNAQGGFFDWRMALGHELAKTMQENIKTIGPHRAYALVGSGNYPKVFRLLMASPQSIYAAPGRRNHKFYFSKRSLINTRSWLSDWYEPVPAPQAPPVLVSIKEIGHSSLPDIAALVKDPL